MSQQRPVEDAFKPCGHEPPQGNSQLHGVCIFCYRDRLGAERSIAEGLRNQSAGGTVKVVRGTPEVGEKVVYVTEKWLMGIEAQLDKAEKENSELVHEFEKAEAGWRAQLDVMKKRLQKYEPV